MYCTNCGLKLKDNINFCGSCGELTTKEQSIPLPNSKAERHVLVKAEDEKLKIHYDKKASSVFEKIVFAIVVSLLVGFVSFFIS